MVKLPIVGHLLSLVRSSRTPRAKQPTATRDERLRSAFEHAPIGIAFATPDGHWLQTNEQFRSTIGYTREELARISFNSMTHPDDAKVESSQIKSLISGELDSYKIRKRTIDKKGHYRAIDVTAAVKRSATGQPEFFVYIIVPARQKHADTSYVADRAAAAAIDQISDVAIIRSDDKGIITGWNAGAQRIFGYERDEIVGKHRRLLYRSGEEARQIQDAEHVDIEEWRAAKGGAHLRVRTWMQPYRPDGEGKSYVEVVTPASEASGIDVRPAMEQLRSQLERERRVGESLREALGELRNVGEEHLKELKAVTVALRKEIDRRKALEDELRVANERLAALAAEPIPAIEIVHEEPDEEEIVIAPAAQVWEPIEEGSVPEILGHIWGAERTGTLVADDGTRVMEFFFEQGRLFSCASNDPSDHLAQRLIARGYLSADQRQRALEIRQHTQLALGRILLILGAITQEQLVDTLAGKLEDEIAELLTWREGKWSFVEGSVTSLKLVPLRVEIDQLLERIAAGRQAVSAPSEIAELVASSPEPAPPPQPPLLEISETPAPSSAAAIIDETPAADFRAAPTPTAEPPALLPVVESVEIAASPSADAESDRIVASANSRKYHRASCTTARRIVAAARIELRDEQEAAARGLERCRLCFR